MPNMSKRTLEKWRKEALIDTHDNSYAIVEIVPELQQRILRLTQILIDQELIKNVRNKMEIRPDYLDEICENCGCSFGSHHGGTSPWPIDYCPGTEGRMDWENGPGTVFKSTGAYKDK